MKWAIMQQMNCREAGQRQIKPNPNLKGVIFRARLRTGLVGDQPSLRR